MLISAGNENLKMFLTANEVAPKARLTNDEEIYSNILADTTVSAKELMTGDNNIKVSYMTAENNNISLNN